MSYTPLMSHLILCSPCLQARSADLLRGFNLIERPSMYITFPCSECGTQTRQRSAWWQQELPLLRQADEALCVRCAGDAQTAEYRVLRLTHNCGLDSSLRVSGACHWCRVRGAEIRLDSDGALYRQIGEVLSVGATGDP